MKKLALKSEIIEVLRNNIDHGTCREELGEMDLIVSSCGFSGDGILIVLTTGQIFQLTIKEIGKD